MRPEDIRTVPSLIAGSFPSALVPYMVYTQRGIGAFLEVDLAHPDVTDAKTLLVAEHEGAVTAFAEFRSAGPGTALLSYLCVAEQQRRRGLGRALIEHFLAADAQVEHMELDVFEDNVPARRLYDGLGFVPAGETAWYRRDLPEATEPLRVHGLHATVAAHRLYGFSQCEVDRGGQRVRLGRIGDGVLRSFDPETFSDDVLLAAFRAAFPTLREALLIASPPLDAAALPEGTIGFLRSHRLRWDRGQHSSRTGDPT